jgi:hypothetical protein
MKMCRRMQVQLHIFLTLALYGSEQLNYKSSLSSILPNDRGILKPTRLGEVYEVYSGYSDLSIQYNMSLLRPIIILYRINISIQTYRFATLVNRAIY